MGVAFPPSGHSRLIFTHLYYCNFIHFTAPRARVCMYDLTACPRRSIWTEALLLPRPACGGCDWLVPIEKLNIPSRDTCTNVYL